MEANASAIASFSARLAVIITLLGNAAAGGLTTKIVECDAFRLYA